MISFTFARITDSTSKFGTAAPVLQRAMDVVSQVLNRELVSAANANITLDVKIQSQSVSGASVSASAGPNYSGKFQATSAGTVPVPDGLVNLVEVKIQTGKSALLPAWNGLTMLGNWGSDVADGMLTLSDTTMNRLIALGNTGFKETDSTIALLVHEVLHMLGFDGSEAALAQPEGSMWRSEFDHFVNIQGNSATFDGPTAMALYGGEIPLRSPDSWTGLHHLHVMNGHGDENVGPGSDLMNGIVVDGMKISDLDVAVLVDLGYRNARTLVSADGHTYVPGAGTQTVAATTSEHIDRAFFGAKRTDYTIKSSSDAVMVANTKSPGDVAQLYGIEKLVFADGVLDARFIGTDGSDVIGGTAAGETLFGGRGNDTLIGGGGIDLAVFSGRADEYVKSKSGNTVTITDNLGRDGTDTLLGIDRLWFADKHVALDVDGNAGDLYRLYQAAFDRKPDLAGLGYWIRALDNGADINVISSGFINAPEFNAMYGAAPSVDSVLTKFYQNVLHREPEKAGYEYWLDVVTNKGVSLNAVLVAFSDSAENQAQVIGSISGGIEYMFYS